MFEETWDTILTYIFIWPYSIVFNLSFHQHLDILEAIHCSFGIVHADLECGTNLFSRHGEEHAWIQRVHPPQNYPS